MAGRTEQFYVDDGRQDAEGDQKWAKEIADRLDRGEDEFIQILVNNGQISSSDARKAFAKMKSLRVVKRDFASGRWSVTHGAYLDRVPIRRAAGLE